MFPGLEPGSEVGWGAVAGPRPIDIPMQTFKFVIFRNADWDYMTFDLARDVEFADKVDNGANNAINPDLRPFFSHHGKLLMYHGWADNQISPNNSVDYYSNVVKTVDLPSKDSIRLFMVPGMGHCGGGDGTDQFDRMSALAQWVEKGDAPEQMIASHQTAGKTDKAPALCLSQSRKVQGRRQHGRRDEFLLPGSIEKFSTAGKGSSGCRLNDG